ncbi:MAG: nitroreductase family protein [Candidatus Aminicenantales bacterium]
MLLGPVLSWGQAPDLKTIKLNEPNKTRGVPVMQAFALRASVREWSDKDLSLQDLSDLLWAANGINRSDGKRTAPSAMNAQDVDIYAFMKDGVYLYDPAGQTLKPIAAGDHRSEVTTRPGGPGAKPMAKPGPGGPGTPAPVQLFLVSDISKFTRGETAGKLEIAALDAGIVSQNIALFCAGTGLATRPRASMDKAKLKELLKLTDTQYPFLNMPVGYVK